MTQIATISLRDAGARLAELFNSRDKVAVGRLIGLLRSGDIKAGVLFPAGARSYWLMVPTSHWAGVSSDNLRVITYSKSNPRSGAYKVRLGQFAEEVAAAVVKEHGDNLDSKMWAPVLAACSKSFEVSIKSADWDSYENQIPRSSISDPRRGRREKESWRATLVLTGAYIVKHYGETQERIKSQEAGEAIWNLCQAEKIPDLPQPRTIGDELAKILAKAETISI
jgi:hypothetical protein